MQKTIFECDQCHDDTSKKGKHISLRLAVNSGIATPPKTKKNPDSHWRVMPDLQGKFVHFCGVKCLSEYFRSLITTN